MVKQNKPHKVSGRKVTSALIFGLSLIIILCLISLYPFLLPIGIIILSTAGLYEFCYLMQKKDINLELKPLVILSLMLILDEYYRKGEDIAIILLLTIFLIPLFNLLKNKSLPDYKEVGVSFYALFYISFLLTYLIKLVHLRGGLSYLVVIILLTWASDIGCYLAGLKLGRLKLTPLSPNKTWEGSIGGMLFCLTIAYLLILTNKVYPWLNLSLKDMLILSIIVSLFAQVGDLYESALKRYAGVKDTGSLIPEHGGILDRFDSLLFVAPASYYYLMEYSLRIL